MKIISIVLESFCILSFPSKRKFLTNIRIPKYNWYKYLLALIIAFVISACSQDNTWRGLRIEQKDRCSPYNHKDYAYPPAIKSKVVESLRNRIYTPYTGQFFNSIKEINIEHIVSLSNAHDSGLCSADKETKSYFASDIRNLTLAPPTLSQNKKAGRDISVWLPEKNKCWFAKKIVEIKKAYDLTVDLDELTVLEKIISKCVSFELIFFNNNNNLSDSLKQTEGQHERLLSLIVKKSRSGVCHVYSSSPYYSRTKHFEEYKSLELCLKSGGKCPIEDTKCNQLIATKHYQYKQLIPPIVKKSRSEICHAYGSSPYYSRTKHFEEYKSLELCLKSGGTCSIPDTKCNKLVATGQYKQLIPPIVKKSRSEICHAYGSSPYYSRTKHFEEYKSLELCLKSGGTCSIPDTKCNKLAISLSLWNSLL